jgi:serine/threonine protein kinase
MAGSSPECDIWSLGVLIIQLFTGITNYLYEEPSPKMADSEIKEKFFENLSKKKPPTILDLIENTPEILPLKAISVGMIRFDPNERPDIFRVADVLNQYFQRNNREQLMIKYDKMQREEFLKYYKK